jgi:hypothetical protein
VHGQVAAVDRAHGVLTEVAGTLVLRDVVAQQWHLPAPAVVAHFPLDTTGPRHLCLEVAPRQISTDHRPAHPHYTGVSQPCKAAPTAATAPRSSAYRFPRNMIRSATASIPSRGSTPLGIDSRTPCSRTRHSARLLSRAVGILRRPPRRGAPAHTRSNNSRRTDFEYGYPLGMTTSKSTEVALTVWIRLA